MVRGSNLNKHFGVRRTLCNVSSAFVSKNPRQIQKRVRSINPTHGTVLQALQGNHKDKLTHRLLHDKNR